MSGKKRKVDRGVGDDDCIDQRLTLNGLNTNVMVNHIVPLLLFEDLRQLAFASPYWYSTIKKCIDSRASEYFQTENGTSLMISALLDTRELNFIFKRGYGRRTRIEAFQVHMTETETNFYTNEAVLLKAISEGFESRSLGVPKRHHKWAAKNVCLALAREHGMSYSHLKRVAAVELTRVYQATNVPVSPGWIRGVLGPKLAYDRQVRSARADQLRGVLTFGPALDARTGLPCFSVMLPMLNRSPEEQREALAQLQGRLAQLQEDSLVRFSGARVMEMLRQGDFMRNVAAMEMREHQLCDSLFPEQIAAIKQDPKLRNIVEGWIMDYWNLEMTVHAMVKRIEARILNY